MYTSQPQDRALRLSDDIELAYPCQAAETALKFKKKRKRKGPSPPSNSDSGVAPGLELVDEARAVFGHLLRGGKRGEHFDFGSLSDVGGDWLEPPLSKADEGMDVDGDQELFYVGTESPHYSQLPLTMLLTWDEDMVARVLADGDPAVQAQLQYAKQKGDVISQLESALDRGHSDRLAVLCEALAGDMREEQLEQLLPAIGASDAYTRESDSRCLSRDS